MMHGKLAVVLACIVALSSVARADLVGWWTFDEGSGTVARDSSGKGNAGAFEGDPEWLPGKFGSSLRFDGDDWLSFGDPAALKFGEGITIACWISPESLSGSHDMVCRDGSYAFKTYTTNLRFTTPTVRDHMSTGVTLMTGAWQHVAVTFQPSQGGGAVFYYNGNEITRMTSSVLNAGTGPFRIGTWQGGASEFFVGRIDDVRVYNHILTESEIKAAMENVAYPYAAGPKPKDGSMADAPQVILEWRAGDLAVSHNVYFGEDKDAVANGTPADTSVFLGSTPGKNFIVGYPGNPYPKGLTPGKTYYWRVDEINTANPESPWKGPVWSLQVRPASAWGPAPADQAVYIGPDDDLSWQKGMQALLHTVYFGESLEEVSAATAGGLTAPDATFDPGPMKPGTTYYWRVDESTVTGQIKGDVWSFTVLHEIPIVDPNLLALWTLDEAAGGKVVDWSGHGNHGAIVRAQWIDGYDGAALWFDGLDDYVNFRTPAALYLPDNYSYCAWFRVARTIHGVSGSQYLLCMGSRSDLIFGIQDSVGAEGELSLHYYDSAKKFSAVGTKQSDWLSDSWHMVVATKEAGVGHKVYLDGDLVNADNNANKDLYATTRIISLGAMAWNGTSYYRGAIDEVRIYNKTLTEQEIQTLMQGDPLQASNPAPSPDAIVDIRDVSSLQWVAGASAVSHDVYFGADRDAVAAGDRASAAFRGNQTGTSFSSADLVDLSGADYYWRIDEIDADGTVHAGQLWKFTALPYLIIDNFESYTNASPHRVFQTWIDGLGFSPDDYFPGGDPGNGTTAMIGYDPMVRRVMETVIAKSGQAVSMDYNNANVPHYGEAVRTWSTPQDWTAGGAGTLQLSLRGNAVRFVETALGQYTMSSASGDVWGTADNFRLVYKRLSGDGTIVAKVNSMTVTALWGKAGVMIRESLNQDAAHALMMMAPDGRPAFQNRPTAGGTSFSAHGNVCELAFPQWVKLERKGGAITGYHSNDGKTWIAQTNNGGGESPNPQTVNMMGDVYIGLAVTSNNVSQSCVVQFSDVATTGSVAGDWQVADIGGAIPGNDPSPLYVVIQDSANKSAVVSHPDLNAVLTTTWIDWQIPLTQFAGVNTKAVKKMYIGVGDRNNPQADGAGRLYIDDICVIKP